MCVCYSILHLLQHSPATMTCLSVRTAAPASAPAPAPSSTMAQAAPSRRRSMGSCGYLWRTSKQQIFCNNKNKNQKKPCRSQNRPPTPTHLTTRLPQGETPRWPPRPRQGCHRPAGTSRRPGGPGSARRQAGEDPARSGLWKKKKRSSSLAPFLDISLALFSLWLGAFQHRLPLYDIV